MRITDKPGGIDDRYLHGQLRDCGGGSGMRGAANRIAGTPRGTCDRGARLAALARAAVGGVVALALAPQAGAVNGQQYDWCSPIVARPDQRFQDTTSACKPVWSATDIAAGADVVLVGDFLDVAHPQIPAPGSQCTPNPNHTVNATYVQSLRAARAQTSNPPLQIVHLTRSELVPATFAALPGFSAGFLLPTDRPWSQVTGFFTNDTSSACATTPCSWSDSFGGNPQVDPPGRRLRDFIDRSGGANKYQSIVYYLARPTTPPVYWPTSAIADLGNAQYRAWRVAEMKEAMRVGGYDMIELSQKLMQWKSGAYWIGQGGSVSNVATLNAQNETYWSAPPRGVGYSQYVRGWNQLAKDMKAAGVPYEVDVALLTWTGTFYDDPSTPTVDEGELIREVMRGAKLLLIERDPSTPAATWTTAEAQMRSYGPIVVPYNIYCGYGRQTPGQPGKPTLKP